MKKEFWEQYTIGDDHIITDNFTGDRLGFFVNPITKTVRFLPEYQYKQMMKNKSRIVKIWESLTKGIQYFKVFRKREDESKNVVKRNYIDEKKIE